MTKTESYIKKLKRLGFTETPTASRKFTAFQHPKLASTIFVGRRANLRIGPDSTVSKSRGVYQPDLLLNKLQQKFIDKVTEG